MRCRKWTISVRRDQICRNLRGVELIEVATNEAREFLGMRRRDVGELAIEAAIADLARDPELGQQLRLEQRELDEDALEKDVDAERPEIPGLYSQTDDEQHEHRERATGPSNDFAHAHGRDLSRAVRAF